MLFEIKLGELNQLFIIDYELDSAIYTNYSQSQVITSIITKSMGVIAKTSMLDKSKIDDFMVDCDNLEKFVSHYSRNVPNNGTNLLDQQGAENKFRKYLSDFCTKWNLDLFINGEK